MNDTLGIIENMIAQRAHIYAELARELSQINFTSAHDEYIKAEECYAIAAILAGIRETLN
jgi:hypothetical protein